MSNYPFSQAVLWSKSINDLDFQRDKNYIIHQVLRYGSLADVKTLKKLYGEREVSRVFSREPIKIYTAPALNFVKNYLLSFSSDQQIDEQKYLTTAPRII